MRITSGRFLLLSLVYAFGVLVFIASNQTHLVMADTNHVVISQVQISGATTNDEFVELYNPTDTTIDISKWRLTRKTSTGGSVQNLVASFSGAIAPKNYYLITHPSASAVNLADAEYSSSSSGMTTNNTVTLYSDAGVTVVDKVGFGTAGDAEVSPFAENPEGSGSIVRKATANSTSQTLFTGGIEALIGNGHDTDNNASDFVLFETSAPKNSSITAVLPTGTISPTPVVTITSTISPTVTPTVSPTQPVVTNTPTPTQIQPTSTATPTSTPSPTHTPTQPVQTATPTVMPTTVPTSTPVPTLTATPVPTAVPTAIPTPTPIPPTNPTPPSQVIVDQTLFGNRKLTCTKTFRAIKIFNSQFFIPSVTCSITQR